MASALSQQEFAQAVQFHRSGQLEHAEVLYERVLRSERNHPDALHLLGVVRHARGDFLGAERHIRAALRISPTSGAMHVSYGNVQRELGRLPDAMKSYSRAAQLDPRLAIAHYNLGTAYEQIDRYPEALTCYERAIQAQADANAWHGRGNCLVALGRVDEAVLCYRNALGMDPGHGLAANNLVEILLSRQQFEPARELLAEALQRRPDQPDLARKLVMVLNVLGRQATALEDIDRLLAGSPDDPELRYLRARSLMSLGRIRESEPLLEETTRLHPENVGAWVDHASVTAMLGHPDAAIGILERADRRFPGDLSLRFTLGFANYLCGCYDEARRLFEEVLAVQPEFPRGKFHVALLDLLRGDFERGLALYEHRWNDSAGWLPRRVFAQPVWMGGDFPQDSVLFVHAEQGLGDTLQFCRYLPLLLERGIRVVFEAQDPVADFVRRSMPTGIDVRAASGLPAQFDRVCPLLSLPLAFSTRVETIPAPARYLTADAARVRAWSLRLGEAGRRRVGLTWSGNPNHNNDTQRSIPLERLRPLLERGARAGFEFIGLQNDISPRDRETLATLPQLTYLGDAIADFDDAAALCEICELVISVDTSIAHLAGALGRPVRILLPFVPDWRWMLEREDTPWYPTARLVRQPARGEWAPVIDRVAGELEAMGSEAAAAAPRDVAQGPEGAGAPSIDVNFLTHFNHTGIGRHSENAFFGILRNRDPSVRAQYVNQTLPPSVKRFATDARTSSAPTVFFWRFEPRLLRQYPGRKVGWIFFETDHLPRRWVEQIDAFDRLWMPSPWGRDVLLGHGIDGSKIRVVEAGVDDRIYQPRPEPHAAFVFLLVGKYEPRKSIEETIEAFLAEFPAARNPKVELWLKADHPVFPERVETLRSRIAADRRIRVLSGVYSDEELAALYNRADAFVFPTKAEGFGLPTIEALACGLPVITPEHTGQGAFLSSVPGLFHPVECDAAPLADPDFEHFYATEFAGEPYGNWFLPRPASIRAAMRAVREEHPAWRERAAQASSIIRSHFSWDRIGRKAIEALRAG